VLTAVVGLALATCTAVVGMVTFLDWELQEVRSGSMAPAYESGALLLTRPANGLQSQVGDVVSFRLDGRLVTHRVIELRPDRRLVTQGDANLTPDPGSLAPNQVESTVVLAVPRVGRAVTWLDQPWAGPVLVVAGLLLLRVPRRRGRHDRQRAGRPHQAPAGAEPQLA